MSIAPAEASEDPKEPSPMHIMADPDLTGQTNLFDLAGSTTSAALTSMNSEETK